MHLVSIEAFSANLSQSGLFGNVPVLHFFQSVHEDAVVAVICFSMIATLEVVLGKRLVNLAKENTWLKTHINIVGIITLDNQDYSITFQCCIFSNCA